MLDLDFIKANTNYVVKFTSGRLVCTEKALKKYHNNKDVKDIDVSAWTNQPKDLQPFYKAYERAIYELGRQDLIVIEDFYNEWIKNPEQFNEDHKIVISMLSKELSDMNVKDDVVIENYNGRIIGNHKVGNFIEALDEIFFDFSVVQITEKYGYPTIIIQEDDEDRLKLLDTTANQCALRHDKFLGDGKYA